MDIGGFRTVQVKFDESCTSSHCLYIKKHTVRVEAEETPPERTMFVLNVPPFCDEDSVQHIFERFGTISSVHLRAKPGTVTAEERQDKEDDYFRPPPTTPGFRCGYVVFGSTQHLSDALRDKHQDVVVLSTDARPVLAGMAKWCQDYRRRWPDPALLHRATSQYVATHEARVAQEKAALAEKAKPDDEGWVTVTRGSKKSVATTTLGKTHQLLPRERRKLKKQQKEKELLHFYEFEQRDTRREQIAQLRKKFEVDKTRISEMRGARKFRPF